MLSAGAFTGCFNYLQLARGLAPSQPLFVCSLHGVCAERNTVVFLYKERKGGEKKFGEPITELSLQPAPTPCPCEQAQEEKPALLSAGPGSQLRGSFS